MRLRFWRIAREYLLPPSGSSHQNDLLNREYLPQSESKTKRGIFAEGSIQALTFSEGTFCETKLSITGLNQ